ncbi:hypothetical protein BGZ54_004061, partial [Gamsiella multidivaricata]
MRRILWFAKTKFRNKLTLSLETPSKSFAERTFKDICAEYNLSEASDPGIGVILPFTDLEAAPLDSDFQRTIRGHLINEVESRVQVLKLFGANEASKSMIVASFIVAATRLFDQELYLASQRNLSGRRGNGPVDSSVHSRKTHAYTLGVTEVKKDGFRRGVAQNIVQLESALTEKKRKRGQYEVEGEEEPPRKIRSYGIVTDVSEWAVIECTIHEAEAVSYRMTKLPETLVFAGNWKQDASTIFQKL